MFSLEGGTGFCWSDAVEKEERVKSGEKVNDVKISSDFFSSSQRKGKKTKFSTEPHFEGKRGKFA